MFGPQTKEDLKIFLSDIEECKRLSGNSANDFRRRRRTLNIVWAITDSIRNVQFEELMSNMYFKCSVRYRGTPGARVWYYVERSKPQWSGALRLKCKEEWQTAWQKVTIPTQGTAPYVAMVLMDGNGWCEFTDPQVLELAEAADGNLLPNADFSVTAEVGGKTVPALWNVLNRAEIELLPHESGKMVRMRCLGSRSHFTQWSLPVVKGGRYTLSLKYRGTPGAGMLLGVERGKPYWKSFKRIKCTGEWQPVEVGFTVPTGDGGVPYAVFATDPGEGYVELADLKLFPAGD